MLPEKKESLLKAIPLQLAGLEKAINKLNEELETSICALANEKAINQHQLNEIKKMRRRAKMDLDDNYQRFNLIAKKVQNELKQVVPWKPE